MGAWLGPHSLPQVWPLELASAGPALSGVPWSPGGPACRVDTLALPLGHTGIAPSAAAGRGTDPSPWPLSAWRKPPHPATHLPPPPWMSWKMAMGGRPASSCPVPTRASLTPRSRSAPSSSGAPDGQRTPAHTVPRAVGTGRDQPAAPPPAPLGAPQAPPTICGGLREAPGPLCGPLPSVLPAPLPGTGGLLSPHFTDGETGLGVGSELPWITRRQQGPPLLATAHSATAVQTVASRARHWAQGLRTLVPAG